MNLKDNLTTVKQTIMKSSCFYPFIFQKEHHLVKSHNLSRSQFSLSIKQIKTYTKYKYCICIYIDRDREILKISSKCIITKDQSTWFCAWMYLLNIYQITYSISQILRHQNFLYSFGISKRLLNLIIVRSQLEDDQNIILNQTTPVLRRPRQDDQKFKTNLGCIPSSRAA